MAFKAQYKDISELEQKEQLQGTEKLPVSDSEFITPRQIAGLVDLSGKVDKEPGKGLSTNDYTNEDKEKLDNLENYDDGNIRELIREVAGAIPTELSQLDDDSTHRTVTDTEKNAWNEKYKKPATGIPSSDLAEGVIPEIPSDTVKFSQQTLTEEQKTQARSNIGATEPELFIATYGTTTLAEVTAAFNAGKIVCVNRGGVTYIVSSLQSTYCYFGSLNKTVGQYVLLNGNSWSVGQTTLQTEANKVTFLSPESKDSQYPSAKAVYDFCADFVTASVDNLVNYYLKSETYTREEIAALIGAIQKFHYEIHPSTSSVANPVNYVLYLIGPTGSGADKYEEYVYDNTKQEPWVKIGDTSIDLSQYVTITALNTALAAYTTTEQLTTLLAGKQNVIPDLEQIRAGATLGSTALQSFTESDPTVPSWAKQPNKPSYTPQEVGALPDTDKYAGSHSVGGPAKKTSAIPYGEVDSTSTATVFTATVPEITELANGVCVLLKNGVVTSASGFTLNINGLGAKPCFNNMTAATRETTIFNINYTMLFIYDSTRVVDSITGAWCCYRGYDANTNTIGYQVRTNSYSLPMSSITYRYRLLFTSADGNYFVPANNSTSTNATASRTVCQDKIDPFGKIVYYGTTASVAAGSRPAVANLWLIYTVTLGYSFNRTGAALTLTSWKPVYVKCAPQTDGSAIIDSTTPYVQDLPTTEDGKIYIFLGVAYSATAIELLHEHPVYYFKDGIIRPWTNPEVTKAYVDGLVGDIETLLAAL